MHVIQNPNKAKNYILASCGDDQVIGLQSFCIKQETNALSLSDRNSHKIVTHHNSSLKGIWTDGMRIVCH